MHRGSSALGALDDNAAAVQIDTSADHNEAEPCPRSIRGISRAKERIEQMGLGFGRNPDAMVAHTENRAGASASRRELDRAAFG
jgi:hypothetical protein